MEKAAELGIEDKEMSEILEKKLKEKLKTIGINSVEELKEIGSKDTWFRLKLKYPEICLVHLYTLEGAISNIEYNQLSEETKRDLKAFIDQWKD